MTPNIAHSDSLCIQILFVIHYHQHITRTIVHTHITDTHTNAGKTNPLKSHVYFAVQDVCVGVCVMYEYDCNVCTCICISLCKNNVPRLCIHRPWYEKSALDICYSSHDIGFNCFYHFTLYIVDVHSILRMLIAFYSKHPHVFYTLSISKDAHSSTIRANTSRMWPE